MINKRYYNKAVLWVVYCLLILTPVFGLGALILTYIDYVHKEHIEQKALRKQAEVRAKSNFFIPNHFTHITISQLAMALKIDQQGEGKQTNKLLDRAYAQFLTKTQIYIFDKNGKIMRLDNRPVLNSRIMENFWSFLTNQNKSLEILNRYRIGFEVIFKRPFLVHSAIYSESQLIRMSDNQGYWFWERFDDGGGIVVIVHSLPCQKDIAMYSLDTFFKGELARIKISEDVDKIYNCDSHSELFEKIDDKLINRNSFWIYHNNYLWTKVASDNVEILSCRYIDTNLTSNYKRWTVAILMSFLFWGSAFWWKYCYSAEFISIRLKFSVFLLYVICVPLTLVLFLVFYLANHQQNLTRETTIKNISEKLFDIDRNMNMHIEDHINCYRKISVTDGVSEGRLELMNRHAQKLYSDYRLHCLELYDSELVPAYRLNDNINLLNLRALSDTVAKNTASAYLKDRFDKDFFKHGQEIDQRVRDLTQGADTGLQHLLQSPDSIHQMELGNLNMILYWNKYKDSEHNFTLIVIGQTMEKAFRNYLIKVSNTRLAIDNIQLIFGAFNVSTGEFLSEHSYPYYLQLLSRWASEQKTPVSSNIRINNKDYLVVAIPSASLDNWTLFSLIPSQVLDEKIANFMFNAVVAIILTIVSAFLAAVFLADSFLKPVAELKGGVEALKTRDGQFRISHISTDEFGQLAMLFNEMIEEAHEMNLAMVVQKNLMPEKPPKFDGYDIALQSIYAADLGGDYVDAFLMPDGKLCTLIGDVTGHGVSSALLMAMARTTVFYSIEQKLGIIGCMRNLNKLVVKLMKRRKRMTFFMGQIDNSNNVLTFSNAGHPYPVICSKEGVVKELEMDHFPLGTSANDNLIEENQKIELCDVIVMFTDGLIETINDDGEEFGYERWFNCIQKMRSKSATEIKDALIKSVTEYSNNRPQSDDFTLLVIKRTH